MNAQLRAIQLGAARLRQAQDRLTAAAKSSDDASKARDQADSEYQDARRALMSAVDALVGRQVYWR